jgi:cell division protein FtsB
MKVALGIWEALTRLVIFLLFVAGILLVAVWYLPVIKKNQRMRSEILRLDSLIQTQEVAGRQLRTSIDALRHDPKTVERLARESLGYAKPGEIVVHFEPPPPTNTAPR